MTVLITTLFSVAMVAVVLGSFALGVRTGINRNRLNRTSALAVSRRYEDAPWRRPIQIGAAPDGSFDLFQYQLTRAAYESEKRYKTRCNNCAAWSAPFIAIDAAKEAALTDHKCFDPSDWGIHKEEP